MSDDDQDKHEPHASCSLFPPGETITREEFERHLRQNPRGGDKWMDIFLRQVYHDILSAQPAAMNRAH